MTMNCINGLVFGNVKFEMFKFYLLYKSDASCLQLLYF